MDQPRVPAGSPEGGQFASKLYHGTTKGNAYFIRMQGLIPEQHDVFLTDSKDRALEYAKRASGPRDEPVVLEVNVPAGTPLGKTTGREGDHTIFSHVGTIPREWIAPEHSPEWQATAKAVGSPSPTPAKGDWSTPKALTDIKGAGAVGPVTVKAYRVGALTDSGRGVFFGDTAASIEPYAYGHTGHTVKEYTIQAKNPWVTESQHSLWKEHAATKAAPTYNDAVYNEDKKIAKVTSGRGDSVLAHARVEAHMAKVLKRKGYDALIYTSPPAPANAEIAILDPKLLKGLS